MSFVSRYKGKYVKINTDNPSALGICDESGFVFNHKDLVKQMEWRGDNLVWTGLMVGKPYVDKPSQQNRPPLVKNDPKAIKNPRPPEHYSSPDANPVSSTDELMAKLNQTKWNS